ncbi:MAG: prolyl oligopeptidase family serine peptidase [Bacteroidales bacterium]|nr:prolyl oligopeptidase family serine peptidase [Bacteroidales bacterium]
MFGKISCFVSVVFFLFNFSNGVAQDDLKYQTPPEEMVAIVDAPVTPNVSMSPQKDYLAILTRRGNPSIADISAAESRIAGLRIDPLTNGPSRLSYVVDIRIKELKTNKEKEVSGLPSNPKITDVQWSPNGKFLAFANTESDGISLWLIKLETMKATIMTGAVLNGIFRGSAYSWMPDGKSIVYKAVIDNRGELPRKPKVPAGPVVQETSGSKAAIRTYQDLLKTPYDEKLFEYLGTSQLIYMDIDGRQQKIGAPGVISSLDPSPDGNYILLQIIHTPYSYLVPYYRFPFSVEVWDKTGKKIKTIAEISLAEEIPKGFGAVRTGPRSHRWRSDVPATVYWVEALDDGDPKKEADLRDQVYFFPAPFSGLPMKSVATQLRYSGILWGNDKLAIISEYWRKTRESRTSFFNPAQPEGRLKTIFKLSSEDRYNDPGSFVTYRNSAGKRVLQPGKNGKSLYLFGNGASPEGNRPFVDNYEISSGKTKRLWRSEAPYYESPYMFMDADKGLLITSRQSVKEPPNYFIRSLKSGKLTKLTQFPHPYPQFKDIQKEIIQYKREDGVQLSFDLYLPTAYKKEDGPLPTFLWAYPREYKSASAAGQMKGSPYTFVRISPRSALVMVTQGYAVLNNASFPIIGEGDNEPNDSFVKQLVANAEAAINKAVDMGVTDRGRVAVGGHSYGAFMTANLLSYTELFAAGIARSGAYNRTLTPFGFQAEPRTYWEAPEIYYTMSPFMHADEVKTPILLIHGMADNNSGTFPIQSERYFSALKGNGATVRLVMLPDESHGYRARESVLHMLWEMNSWLEKYVKNK